MQKILLDEAAQYTRQNLRRRVWRKLVRAMACAVVFCTTYALILPAITMEKNPCGLSEHTHSETCYEKVASEVHESLACTYTSLGVHAHKQECYNEDNLLICGQADYLIHEHTDNCVDENGAIVCQIPEVGAHAHTDACYEAGSVSMSEPENGDAFSANADTVEPELICTEPIAQVHVHGEECFAIKDANEDSLTCTQVEGESHTHSKLCYGTWKLICDEEEHTHNLACRNDPNADVESEAVWTATFADIQLTGERDKDLLAIAQSQLGYRESTLNYEVMEDGETIKGYTRYGDWYGTPYGDWDAMFVSFCLNYADVTDFPQDCNSADWITALQEQNLYASAAEYVPSAGDLIFFDADDDTDEDTNAAANHVGIVETVVGSVITTIEGDSDNCVVQKQYSLHDDSIIGYGLLNKSPSSVTEDPAPVKPEGTDAWAVLVNPDGEVVQEPLADAQDEPEESAAATESSSVYALRKTSETSTYEARAAETQDLTPHINAVTMYDENGNVIPNGTLVTEGDLIKFEIQYTIAGQVLGVMNGDTISNECDTLVYKLPEIFEVIRSDSGNIINSAGQTVGTFVIDSTTGTITMKFTQNYVQQNAKGLQIQGSISFFSTVTKINDDDKEEQNFEFKDGISLGIVVEENKDETGNLNLEKHKASVDGEEIVYELKISSSEGTNGPITITDRMSEGLTFQKGLDVKKNGTTVNNPAFNAAGDNRSFTLTLPQMEPGDTYIVRYRCKADIDLLGADMTVRNTATVTGKNSSNRDLKVESSVDHTFDVLKKTGEANDDGTIDWTITVNTAKADISGWILEDILVINNKSTSYTGPVTIKDSKGNIVANNAKLPYTFPNGSTDTYTITYTTSHDYGDGDTIFNKAVLKDKDTEVNVNSGVGIGTPIQKTGTAGEIIQDENGTNLLPITWTVTIDTSGGEIPAGSVLNDSMQDWNASEMYMTYEQLMAAYENIKTELKRVGSDAVGLVATKYVPGMDGSHVTYRYNDLINNVNNAQSEVFEKFSVTIGSAVPKGNTLIFTYESYGAFVNNMVVGSSYVNVFNIGEHYEVKGRVDLLAGNVNAKKLNMRYYDPNSEANQDWQFDYSAAEGTSYFKYEDLHDSYLAWGIELSVPPDYWGTGNILLKEDLPEGISVKGLKMQFFSEVPTSRLTMSELELGQTYTWDFTLYPADQYGVWNPQGGQLVSIEVKLTEAGDLEITIPGIVFETMAQRAVIENQWRNEEQKLTEWYTYLYIYTQINDDFDWPEHPNQANVYVNNFENYFTVTDETGRILDTGFQHQHITKDESTGVVRKEGAIDSNNILNYSVVLNAYGRDLIPNADTLSVHDALTYESAAANPLRLRLVPGSVKLYEIDLASDGSYTKGEEVAVLYSYRETASEASNTTTWVNTLDLTIPDDKALVLEYSYKVNGKVNSMHNVGNTCTITGGGGGDVSGDSNLELEVKQTQAQADTKGVMLYKVDSNSDGIFLKNAKFNIYIWNKEQNKYIIVHHPTTGNKDFVTDDSGMILLDGSTMNQFAYNTAYYIVEVESPEGYFLSSEPYYFQIANPDTVAYKPCLPDGFTGDALTSGDIIYRKNTSNVTEISIEKYWQDYGGKPVTITGEEVSSITVELWQTLQGNPNSAKLYNTYTMTPDENGEWKLTIGNLPKSDGPNGQLYLYSIKEVAVNGYILASSENNSGINHGTIQLVNREQEGYILPETGDAGTTSYTMAGLLLMLFSAAFLMYKSPKRRREAP